MNTTHSLETVVPAKNTNIPFSDKIKVDSWWRWIFYHCSYCLCKCDAPGPKSDRFWSLKEATSNIKKNFVVTGVRIRKIGRVLHPEIQQGKATPEGSVDESSRVWKEAREIRVNDDTAINDRNNEYMTMSYEQVSLNVSVVAQLFCGAQIYYNRVLFFGKKSSNPSLEIQSDIFFFLTEVCGLG